MTARRGHGARRSLVLGLALAGVASSLFAPVTSAASPDLIDRATPLAPRGPTSTAPLRAVLQRRLDKLLARDKMPGVSVAILFPDGTTWVGTSGMADIGAREPVTPDTAFALASVSKTFTAALIMALRDEGLIDLETPVVRYVPELPINRRITVHQLLDHTSGLRDFFLDPRIDKALMRDRGRTWDADRAFRYVGKPYFKPGKGWHYSNTNYLILGILAERVGGASLGDQLRERFFEPLGLRHTYDQVTERPGGPVAHGYRFASTSTKPIDLSDGTAMAPFTSVVTAAGGSGSLASTPLDLVHWARALYSGVVVSPESLGAMVDDIATTAKRDPTIPYGLGVQGVELDGHAAFGHSGRLLGFRSLVRWLPRERIGIAVLTNQSRTDPAAIARSLLRLALAPANGCAECRAPR
jgi:D-alanyl-D-alanine carboxypeptidase